MSVRPRSTLTGVTLVELLVTLSLVAIILTLAVPGFRALIANAKMTNAANSLIGHLQFARSEAVKRNAACQGLPERRRTTCVARVRLLADGYIVRVDRRRGRSSCQPILRRVDPEEMRGVTDRARAGPRSFVYQARRLRGREPGTLKMCDPATQRVSGKWSSNRMGRHLVRCNDAGVVSCARTLPAERVEQPPPSPRSPDRADGVVDAHKALRVILRGSRDSPVAQSVERVTVNH